MPRQLLTFSPVQHCQGQMYPRQGASACWLPTLLTIRSEKTLETSCKPSCWPCRPCRPRDRGQLGKSCLSRRAGFPMERWASYSGSVFWSRPTPSFPSSQHLLPSIMFSVLEAAFSFLESTKFSSPLPLLLYTISLGLFIYPFPSRNSGLLFKTYIQLLLKQPMIRALSIQLKWQLPSP